MDRAHATEFKPNYAIPPGETLRETLDTLGMTQAQLAERTGRPKKTINEIVSGKAAITAETALQLERVLGVPASFWSALERNYRETLARLGEEKRLQADEAWLRCFPISTLIRCGWLARADPPVAQLQALLNFFGVAGAAEWKAIWESPRAAFRTSAAFQHSPHAVAAWLRQGELEAHRIACQPYDEDTLCASLEDIRKSTRSPISACIGRTVDLCARAGVAVVFVPELPGTRAYGATRWIGPSKALMQLSLRGKSDDHLWFTFFHESGHLLLHGKRSVFIEGRDSACKTSDDATKEEEADKFASDFLIPPEEYSSFKTRDQYDDASIRAFARNIGIAPGIVVGRLQHDGAIPYSRGNRLKRPLRFVEN